jgi:hypothetical protein
MSTRENQKKASVSLLPYQSFSLAHAQAVQIHQIQLPHPIQLIPLLYLRPTPLTL